MSTSGSRVEAGALSLGLLLALTSGCSRSGAESPDRLDLPEYACVDVDLGEVASAIEVGSNAGLANEFSGSSCAPQTSGEWRYLWTVPTAGTWTVSTAGSAFDTVLTVLSGTCDGADEVVCSDDVSGGDRTSRVDLVADAGATVLIVVEGYRDAAGEFTLSIGRAR